MMADWLGTVMTQIPLVIIPVIFRVRRLVNMVINMMKVMGIGLVVVDTDKDIVFFSVALIFM